MKKIELLAPVGSFDSLKAAVQNGANAVYLGGKDFSARASANNFDRNELIEAVKYSHIRGVQVFVTVNTLIFIRFRYWCFNSTGYRNGKTYKKTIT